MKKYLMTGIAALAMCFGFTSCSHEIEQVSQEDLNKIEAQKIIDNYNQAFIKTFGQPAANQDWGFGTTATRAAEPNSNQWFDGITEKYKHLVKPADVTAREEEVVTKWFKDNKNPKCDEISLSEFFVQQVHFGDKEYTAKDGNGANHSVIGGNQMDWLFAYTPTETSVWINGVETKSHMDHINNFNTSAPKRTDTGLSNMQLMMNSSTENFGFHESYNSQNTRYYNVKEYNWVIKAISVDGVIGYYVGFDYESHGNQGDFLPDGYFDDRIINIVPGEGYPKGADIRIIAEDLNAEAQEGDTENSDWDFNDVVFDVKFTSDNSAEITLVAAGGTLPLIVGVDNPTNGVAYPENEVHALFGVDVDYMVNTINKQTHPNLKGGAPVNAAPKIDITKVGVKADNGKSIPIFVEKVVNGQKIWVEMKAIKGQPAAKIGVDPTFVYCEERQDIKTKYNQFSECVTTNSNPIWWTGN